MAKNAEKLLRFISSGPYACETALPGRKFGDMFDSNQETVVSSLWKTVGRHADQEGWRSNLCAGMSYCL